MQEMGWTIIRWVSMIGSYGVLIAAFVLLGLGVMELTKKKSQEIHFTPLRDEADDGDSFIIKHIVPLLPPLIVWIKPYLKEAQLERAKLAIRRAGYARKLQPEEFFALKYLACLVFPFAIGLGMTWFIGSPNAAYYFAGLVFGWFVFDLWLYELAKRRTHRIMRSLPDLLDMMVLMVEAGLDLTAAIMKILETLPPGPLKEELQTATNDMKLGAPRTEALKAMADRIAMMEVNSFIAVLVQAIEMGASIGPVLRVQADVLRLSRFQKAERLGAEAANKVLIPMFLFIFPAIFLVVIGPVAVDFIRNPIQLF